MVCSTGLLSTTVLVLDSSTGLLSKSLIGFDPSTDLLSKAVIVLGELSLRGSPDSVRRASTGVELSLFGILHGM